VSVNAYIQTQNVTESTRQTEYRLFAQVTSALMSAQTAGRADLIKALNWNRRMWIVLEMSCASDDNELPKETRAGIISLAMWVSKHSTKVLNGEGDVQAIIQVNRAIMDGLAGNV
jgi:flagellar biosynthesis activator protein FlaF